MVAGWWLERNKGNPQPKRIMGRKALLRDFTWFSHMAPRVEQQSDLIG